MSVHKPKRIIFLLFGVVLFLLVSILSVILIQREIRWKDTRREMDVMEQDILQKIAITDNERLPAEMLQSLYTAIMTDETEVNDQHIPAFEALTEEFLKRINKQMNISLKPEDLESRGYIGKSDIEKYGDVVSIAYYQFVIGEERFIYQYYANNRMTKSIAKGTRRVNLVDIYNENNENLSPIYSEWKSKFDIYFGKQVSMSNYYEFMKLWETDALPNDVCITINNISNLHLYKWRIDKGGVK